MEISAGGIDKQRVDADIPTPVVIIAGGLSDVATCKSERNTCLAVLSHHIVRTVSPKNAIDCRYLKRACIGEGGKPSPIIRCIAGDGVVFENRCRHGAGVGIGTDTASIIPGIIAEDQIVEELQFRLGTRPIRFRTDRPSSAGRTIFLKNVMGKGEAGQARALGIGINAS